MTRKLIYLSLLVGLLLMTACSSNVQIAPDRVKKSTNTEIVKRQTAPPYSAIEGKRTRDEKERNSLVIYSLDLEKYSGVPIEQIPYYTKGDISHLQAETIQSFEEGHHPWLAHVETYITINASNLVPEAYLKQGDIDSKYVSVDMNTLNEKVQRAYIKISNDYEYEILLESRTNNVLYITKIILHTTIPQP